MSYALASWEYLTTCGFCCSPSLSKRVTGQTFTIPDATPEAMYWPSGDQASEITQLVCPVYVCCSCPVAAFQTHTIESSPPTAIALPPGSQITSSTRCWRCGA